MSVSSTCALPLVRTRSFQSEPHLMQVQSGGAWGMVMWPKGHTLPEVCGSPHGRWQGWPHWGCIMGGPHFKRMGGGVLGDFDRQKQRELL